MATGLTIMGLHFQQIGHFRDWRWGGEGGKKILASRDLGY